MPLKRNLDDAEGDGTPKMGFFQRIRYSIVVPDGTDDQDEKSQLSAEEIEDEIDTITEKERAVGLLVAPVAAIVALIISAASISYAKDHNQSYSIYTELTYVLLGMSVLILVTALLRKRLYLGITTALYGLGIFNLHYWGFGVPFIMVGAWYLVRAYRMQQNLRRVTGGRQVPPRPGAAPRPVGPRPRRNKRYTPPT
jgi:hypothetical protein